MASRLRWCIIGLLCAGMMISYFDRVKLSVALADRRSAQPLQGSLRLTDTDRGVLNSAFFWSYAVLQIPAGWLVDRYGVKFPFAIGFVFWSLTSAATALAGSIRQLLGLRVLLGVGESVTTPAGMRWIRFHCPESQRGLAVGLYMAAAKIGPGIGAPLAAWLIGLYGWRMMFLIVGLGGLVWLAPWLKLVADDDREIEATQLRKTPGARVPFLAMMASPVIWGTITGTFCYQYFVYFCMTWMPAYFVERHNLSLESTSLYTMFSFVGMAAVATLAGWAADRMIARGGDPVRVRKAFTIAGFLVASTELIGALSHSPSVSLFFAVFSLSGLGLTTANYWALTQTLIPGAAVGRIVGIQNCAANLPGIVAPLLTGWLKQATGSYTAPMQVIWVFLLAGVASYLFLVRAEYAPAAVIRDSSPAQ
ncbi:MAG: MFS transporter [Bryobacteraceae bacterium]|jgi:MFS family permease